MKSVSKFLSAIALGTALAHQPVLATGKMDTILVTEAFHSLLYLPVYVAKHEGIFKKHGIDVPVVRSAGSGPTALASVLAGEAQFSVHGPEHVGFAQERGDVVGVLRDRIEEELQRRGQTRVEVLADLAAQHPGQKDAAPPQALPPCAPPAIAAQSHRPPDVTGPSSR